MTPEQLQAMERITRSIGDRTRYPRSCPKWLRPLLHVFRSRDINRDCAELLQRMALEIARQSARIRELEAIASWNTAKPRILFDVTCTNLNDHRTGIQRVVRNLAREFIRMSAADTEFVLVKLDAKNLSRADDFAAKLGLPPSSDAPEACIAPRPTDTLVVIDAGWMHRDRYEQAMRLVNAAGGCVISVVHDLIPLTHPALVTASGSADFLRWFELLLRQSRGLVCISRTVADDVRRALADRGTGTPPVDYFHLGVSPEEFAAPCTATTRERVDRIRAASANLFLMVGSLEIRKGHDHALDAFDRLWSRGVDVALVVVGSGTWIPSPVIERIKRHPQLNRRLFWLPGCDDAELHACYQKSDALLFASMVEGFGLPLVEAARAELPIICSDIPVFREICGEHACYYPSGDGEALETTISRWIEMKATGTEPLSRGMRFLTWSESAARLHAAIKRLSDLPQSIR